MTLRLTIEGTASQLSMILASLPDGVAASAALATPVMPQPSAAPIPAPGVQPIPQMAPAAPSGGDEDEGTFDPNAPAVDSSGLPWDERIHAGTKATNADGTWKKRRGGPTGAAFDAIVNELRSRAAPPMPQPPAAAPIPAPVMSAPIPLPVGQPVPMPQPSAPLAPPAPIPAPGAQPVPTEYGAAGAMPVADPAPAPIPMPVPAPPPAPEPMQTAVAVASGTLDFAGFMAHLSEQMSKRDAAGAPLVHADYLAQLTNEISAAFAPHGVPALSAITDIATNPNMITYAVQCMQRDGRW